MRSVQGRDRLSVMTSIWGNRVRPAAIRQGNAELQVGVGWQLSVAAGALVLTAAAVAERPDGGGSPNDSFSKESDWW